MSDFIGESSLPAATLLIVDRFPFHHTGERNAVQYMQCTPQRNVDSRDSERRTWEKRTNTHYIIFSPTENATE